MSQIHNPNLQLGTNKIWVYFKQCDDDINKVKCILCSAELYNEGTTPILCNHIKVKHPICNNVPIEDKKSIDKTELNMTQTKSRRETKNLRKNLDLIDYHDYSLTSMKPLPSSSLSKNLISRLNEISSPVTRKLKFWNKKSFQVNQYDPSFKVIYLGNLGMQFWSKDENCLEKPLSSLWNNYLVNMKTEIVMRLTICNSGLKAITRQHGLTQYWSNRHEGKKMRQELRCHAVFCPSQEKAAKMVALLNQRLACALQEYKREKKSRGLSMLENISSKFHQDMPRTVPLRRQILAKGSANFRLPFEKSKSAPKLASIMEEDYDSDDVSQISQDEFEYEQSFPVRDEDGEDDHDNDDDDDNNEKSVVNPSANDFNLDNIVNNLDGIGEEKQDHSSRTDSVKISNTNNNVNANGDITTNDIHQRQEFLQKSSIDDPTIESTSGGRSDKSIQLTCSNIIFPYESTTKDTESKTAFETTNDKTSQEIHLVCANINTSSSFNEQDESISIKDVDKNCINSLDNLEIKINTSSSNKKHSQNQMNQQTDDVSQEIILSWSNLVIK